MATYVTPQPLWKRNLAGILDFVLCMVLIGLILNHMPGAARSAPVVVATPTGTVTHYELVSFAGWRLPLLVGLTVVYFLGLGRTGGTAFQRLFGMKRP